MCSSCSCGHVDIFSVENNNVFSSFVARRWDLALFSGTSPKSIRVRYLLPDIWYMKASAQSIRLKNAGMPGDGGQNTFDSISTKVRYSTTSKLPIRYPTLQYLDHTQTHGVPVVLGFVVTGRGFAHFKGRRPPSPSLASLYLET